MARMQILKLEEQQAFDSPPIFTSSERKHYIQLTKADQQFIETLRHPEYQVLCLVNLAYFKANKRFYSQAFHANDIVYAAKQLGVLPETVHMSSYDRMTQKRHKQLILEHVGFQAYTKTAEATILPELQMMIRSHKRPKRIFEHLVGSLIKHRIEVPSYFRLYSLISAEMQHHKETLLEAIQKYLTPTQQQLLDSLLEPITSEGRELSQYPTTLLKHFSQSVQPSKIQQNVQDVQQLKKIFQQIEGVLTALTLAPESLHHYAQTVLQARAVQILRRTPDDRYLHLIAFISHQFYKGQDVLLDTLLKTTQTSLNTVAREHKDAVFEQRNDSKHSLKRLVHLVQKGLRSPLATIEGISEDNSLSADAKIEQIQQLFSLMRTERTAVELELDLLNDDTQKMLVDAEYYELLESKSRKLQNRVAAIIKCLDFKGDDLALLEAIQHFQAKDGLINQTAPQSFLKAEQQQVLITKEGTFRISLYKFFLFIAIATKLKAGYLHIQHSYKYRSLDDYLISRDKWAIHKEYYLHQAKMTQFADAPQAILGLKQDLHEQYQLVNTDILEAKNPYFKPRQKGFVLTTPKADSLEAEPLSHIFPKGHYISLVEVLHTVQKQTRFLDAFEHWQHQQRQTRPSEQSFFAGIIGYGCNIGIDKLAHISRNLSATSLEHTVNWYFSLDNLLAANDKVIACINSMRLADIYRSDPDNLHTSSDGQKFELRSTSLLASHSFKYFGQHQGISSYSFVDERNIAFYSTVISANEPEMAYVLDGLMHNDVIRSDIHSTDTHGYSEAIFAASHLLDVYFAPRIKNFAKQRLYSFETIASYKALNYPLLPDAYIDIDLIQTHWDDILRFVTTIKLKEATASQLFKRLNSYAKQNPLYKALKEFGKIIKSLFMLHYVADVSFRQAIEKQLNKGELANRLNKAISGGNQPLIFTAQDTLNLADACRRLIKNAILCWNYLYLSKQLSLASPAQQPSIIQAIKAGSPVAWRHINMHGEYDFSDNSLVDSQGLSHPNLLTLFHLDNWQTLLSS